jgi:hypothetical protein
VSSSAFEILAQETAELTQEPTGVGLDVPSWLASLEQEVESERRTAVRLDDSEAGSLPLDQAKLTLEEVQSQLSSWELNPN